MYFILPKLQKQRQSLEDLLEDFLYDCQLKDLRPKTIIVYEKSLKLLFKFLEEDYKIIYLEEVKESHIKDYIEFTKERGKYSYVSSDVNINNNPSARADFGKKISLATVSGYLRNIKNFFNWCYGKKLMKESITANIKEIKFSRKPKEEITTEEFNRLLRVLDLTLFSEYRDYCIIQALMDTGMRIGECLDLKVSDVDLKNRSIYITADIAKGRKDRYVFFSNIMQKTFQRWIAYKDRYYESELLFLSNRGSKMTVCNFEKNFRNYVRRARVGKKLSPHCLRNNFAKKCLLNGMDIMMVSKILGHSDVRVTQQAYMDLTTEDIRKSYQRFSPLENMKKNR